MGRFPRQGLLLALLVLLTPTVGKGQGIGQIVFFGDSLSDSGNHFIFSGSSSRQPFSVEPPSDSYDIGGHHFSNGNTWAEQLAAALSTPVSGGASLRAPGVFTNYAVGRARARAGAPAFPHFDLRTQVNQFLVDFGEHVPADTLVAIWIGGDDVEDALGELISDPGGTTSAKILEAACAATFESIAVLYGAGARMFLVVNIPDFAYTPYVRLLDASLYPGIATAATTLTESYNGALSDLVNALPFVLPPDPIHPMKFFGLFDANALLVQIIKSPASFGIDEVSNRCTTPATLGDAICSSPNRYLFWDAIHPTSAAHTAVAHAALQRLAVIW